MALNYSCDGCGKSITEFQTFGIVSTCDYCPECAESVKAFIDARDQLHTYTARMFSDGVKRMIEAWKEEFPEGKLPDQ